MHGLNNFGLAQQAFKNVCVLVVHGHELSKLCCVHDVPQKPQTHKALLGVHGQSMDSLQQCCM